MPTTCSCHLLRKNHARFQKIPPTPLNAEDLSLFLFKQFLWSTSKRIIGNRQLNIVNSTVALIFSIQSCLNKINNQIVKSPKR